MGREMMLQKMLPSCIRISIHEDLSFFYHWWLFSEEGDRKIARGTEDLISMFLLLLFYFSDVLLYHLIVEFIVVVSKL